MPQMTKDEVLELAQKAWFDFKRKGNLPTTFVFCIRGYWPVSMGPTNKNDTNQWDDAWFLITPDRFVGIPANVDPTRYGWNAGAGKPMAVLNCGFWPFRLGPHKGRIPALRQISEDEAANIPGVPDKGNFVVTRTYAIGDKRNQLDVGYFAINMHRGGINSTSSEGCLTAPQHLFDEFMNGVWTCSKEAKLDFVWVGLIDKPVS